MTNADLRSDKKEYKGTPSLDLFIEQIPLLAKKETTNIRSNATSGTHIVLEDRRKERFPEMHVVAL